MDWTPEQKLLKKNLGSVGVCTSNRKELIISALKKKVTITEKAVLTKWLHLGIILPKRHPHRTLQSEKLSSHIIPINQILLYQTNKIGP